NGSDKTLQVGYANHFYRSAHKFEQICRHRWRRQNVGYSNFSQPQSHLSFCILILNSFLGSSDSLVFSALFHSLAPRPLAARSISDFLLTYLATYKPTAIYLVALSGSPLASTGHNPPEREKASCV